MGHKLFWPILVLIIVILASISFAQTESDYLECEGPDGTYRIRKVTSCSEIEGPEKAAKSFYEMILKTGVRGQDPAEINKRIEDEIKKVTTPPGNGGYKLLGLYTWGCENGYTIHNSCRYSRLEKEEGGYIITAYEAEGVIVMGFTASIMLHKADWLGGSDRDLWVSVVEKENPWWDPPSMEVIRKNFKQIPKTIKMAEKLQSMADKTLNYILAYSEEYKKVYCSALLALASGKSLHSDREEIPDYISIISPDPDRSTEIKTGTPEEIQITCEYGLYSAESGIMKVEARANKRMLFSRNYPVKADKKQIKISFPVTLKINEPVMSVTLELLPEGWQSGPKEFLRYVGDIGTFKVSLNYKKPIPAHQKNKTNITIRVTDQRGLPISGREFLVTTLALHIPYLDGGWLKRSGNTSVYIKTDEKGEGTVIYIPPSTLKGKIKAWADPSIYFPVSQKLELSDRVDTYNQASVEILLDSPYPKITKLAVPGGDLAGTWQKTASVVVISDADSNTFNVTVWGNGEFGYAGGHGYKDKLEVKNVKSPFRFRFKTQKFGLDLNDLPNILEEFTKTNLKIFMRYATLVGGKKLLNTSWVRGAKAQRFIRTSKGVELPFTAENLAKAKDSAFSVVSKFVTPDGTLATKAVDIGDYILSSQKNVQEGMPAYANLPKDQKISIREESGRESIDAMLDGLHTTIGLLDTCQSFADLVKGMPVDPYSEGLKILYENAKTFYQIHRKFKDVAESWEDILFMPIIVEVKDNEGHSTRRMAKYGVKFSRKAYQ